jgi:NCAIR mutase (PurE)-related protein
MLPNPVELRAALSPLFPDPAALEIAVGRLVDGRTDAVQRSDADVDLQRVTRCGFPEVIFGEGKAAELVVHVLRQQQAAGQDGLVTRVNQSQVDAVMAAFPQAVHNALARTLRVPVVGVGAPVPHRSGPVLVVTAGSSDRPVAEEAIETLKWMNVSCELLQDCGVAGPQRLLRHVPRLRQAVVIVCVAGMEAALPSVLGGHVSCPVIGVPTSVGYGASLQGLTAMLSMLTCCASNVVAVNIDAGFKGGYVAGLIASRSTGSPPSDTPQTLTPPAEHTAQAEQWHG